MLPTSPNAKRNFDPKRPIWTPPGDASLNWLAFGLLLAAWSAVDTVDMPRARRPDALRGYAAVSVRGAQRARMGANVGDPVSTRQ